MMLRRLGCLAISGAAVVGAPVTAVVGASEGDGIADGVG